MTELSPLFTRLTGFLPFPLSSYCLPLQRHIRLQLPHLTCSCNFLAIPLFIYCISSTFTSNFSIKPFIALVWCGKCSSIYLSWELLGWKSRETYASLHFPVYLKSTRFGLHFHLRLFYLLSSTVQVRQTSRRT
jgi:hypothetical protein